MKTRCGLTLAMLLAFSFFGATYGQQTKSHRAGSKFNIVTYELPSWGNGAPRLLIELPEGIKVRLSNEVDFDVYSIFPADGDGSFKIGIYVGHHPSPNSPASASKKPATVDSVPVIWRTWQAQEFGKTVHHGEALVENFFPCGQSGNPDKEDRKLPPNYQPSPNTAVKKPPLDGGCGLQMHVFMQAGQQEEIDRMISWIGTLRKKN